MSSFSIDRIFQRIVEGLNPEDKEIIFSIKRCLNPYRTISTRVEFVFEIVVIPKYIVIEGFAVNITPVILRPSRCFRCQRFCYVAAQCRSSKAYCEFCSEGHRTILCPKCNNRKKCQNCREEHLASSTDCPIYKMEFEVSKMRYLENVGRVEAIEILRKVSPELLYNFSSNPGTPSSNHNEINNNEL